MLERKIVVVFEDAHLHLQNISRLENLLNNGFTIERADVFRTNRVEEKIIYVLIRERDYDGKSSLKNIFPYVKKAVDPKDIAEGRAPYLKGDGRASDGNIIYDTWYCPNCNAMYELEYDDYDYCPKCGQKIDWEGIEGNA